LHEHLAFMARLGQVMLFGLHELSQGRAMKEKI